MKDKRILSIIIEYGKANLKQIILNLLKQEFINYITINEK